MAQVLPPPPPAIASRSMVSTTHTHPKMSSWLACVGPPSDRGKTVGQNRLPFIRRVQVWNLGPWRLSKCSFAPILFSISFSYRLSPCRGPLLVERQRCACEVARPQLHTRVPGAPVVYRSPLCSPSDARQRHHRPSGCPERASINLCAPPPPPRDTPLRLSPRRLVPRDSSPSPSCPGL